MDERKSGSCRVFLSIFYYSLCGNLNQFSRKVVDTVRSVDLIAHFKAASTTLLIATRSQLGPQATLFVEEPNKSNDIHWAVGVLR